MEHHSSFQDKLPRRLTVFDSVCIMTGIIIGTGIYETVPTIAASLGSLWLLLVFWIIGALLSLAGALCYAELATAYPKNGGEIIYLKQAYGPCMGFLFAWAKIVVIQPGVIASMSFPFARYAETIYRPAGMENVRVFYALFAVILLTLVNVIGVSAGKCTQNALSVVKLIGLSAIALTALFSPLSLGSISTESSPLSAPWLALILILFTFGGWSDIAYVAAEVKEPSRNIPRALIWGVTVVATVYVAVTFAFVSVLGFERVCSSAAVATDTVAAVFPGAAPRLVSLLICISTLGALSALIFTGARIYDGLGNEFAAFSLFSFRNTAANGSVQKGPVRALLLQGLLSIVVVCWAGSFNRSVLYTTGVVWLFYSITALSMFVLRYRFPSTARPYRTWGYPFTPIIFSLSCLGLTYSGITYDPMGTAVSLLLVCLGVPVYAWIQKKGIAQPPPQSPNTSSTNSR